MMTMQLYTLLLYNFVLWGSYFQERGYQILDRTAPRKYVILTFSCMYISSLFSYCISIV